MSQPPLPLEERRRDARKTAAFSFWFHRPNAKRPVGAWMLNISDIGAAFLTVAGDAPLVGERLELERMYSADRPVRDAEPPLARSVRVVRVGDADGATRRVSIRFEQSNGCPRNSDFEEHQHMLASRHAKRAATLAKRFLCLA